MSFPSVEPNVVQPLGAQRPRICHVPDHESTAGDEAIEVAELAGLYLDDWQKFVLRGALGERVDGKWSAATVGLVVARQNGKNSILEALELWGLFVGRERLILHTAHEQKTATNHFKRLVNLIDGVPEFSRRVKSAPKGKGSEAIELLDGAVIFFSTRTGSAGRGLTADRTVYDEAMHLSEDERSSLSPTKAALSMHGNTQSWYVGSAVDQQNPKHDGRPLTQVRAQGIAHAKRVAFFEWSAPGDDPERLSRSVATDPHMWALANPGLGIRISHEYIEHEQSVELGPRGFAVERLGVGDWPDISEDAARVISREAWVACAERDPENRVVQGRAFAVDVNPDRTWGSIGAAGQRADGRWQFAVRDRRRKTDWIVPACVELHEEFPEAPFVVLARSPAVTLVDDLEAAGIAVTVASGADYGVACGDWFDAVDSRAARYPFPQGDLDEALSGARKNSQEENAWTWSRKASTSADISPLVAVTLALWAAMNGESQFATVLLPNRLSLEEQVEREREDLGPQAPVVIGPEEYTSCFRCATGSPCPVHGE